MARLDVSAIIPTYDRAVLIPRAIRSAALALLPTDEIIVVDDGSTDDTVAVARSMADEIAVPLQVLERPHAGAGAARNAGVEAARGPLITFLDSDDEWHPDKIELQRALLEARPDVLFTFSDFGVRTADGTEHHNFLHRWMNERRSYEDSFGPGVPYSSITPLPKGRADFQVRISSMYAEEMRHNLITAFTFLGRKLEQTDALRFAEDLPTAEEWHAFGRFAGRGQGAFMETETAWQNGHAGARLSSARRSVLADAWLKTLDRVWGQDEEFLATHRTEYGRARSTAQLMKAASLVKHGELRGAAHSLRMAGAVAVAIKGSQWLAEILSGGPPG